MTIAHGGARGASSARPNILWIVSEDCPPRFGCYGDELASTPHLDAFAGGAVLYELAFSPSPVCAPTRFGLLTGVEPHAHGPAHQMRARAAMPSGMSTYPELLRGAGYHCTNNAKTDYNAAVDPDAIWDECSPDAHWRDRPAGAPFCAVFNIDGTHESAVFRRRPPEIDPARVALPPYLPDTPEIRADIARYYRDIAEMDARVGELLGQLAEDDLVDDTVVIQCSDHGSGAPRTKRHCFDEGMHVPLMIRPTPAIASLLPAPGSRVAHPVSTLDIPATLLAIAGIEPPEHLHSVSLLGAATPRTVAGLGPVAHSGRNRMDERDDVVRTVRSQRYRYTRNYLPGRPSGQHQAFGWLAASYQSWHEEHLAGRTTEVQGAFFRARPAIELYDLATDPHEVRNRAGDPGLADVKAALDAALRAHAIAIGDDGFLHELDPRQGHRRDEPPAVDRAALIDLAEVASARDPAAVDALVAALDHPDPAFRRWGALGLESVGVSTGPARQRLRALLADEPDPMVRVAAAAALATTGDAPDAVEAIADHLDAAHPWRVRLEALEALGRLPTAEVVPHVDRVRAVVDEAGEYDGNAARHLLAVLTGTFTPRAPTFAFPSR